MNRLTLIHLTFAGPGVQEASVAFGPKVTVVRGPSDTGKSFVVSAIDFMLGAKSLKQIPEMSRYSRVLLGLRLPSGQNITLSRSVNGGTYGVYDGDLRSIPIGPPSKTLASKLGKNSDNISSYLLEQIALADRRVRKNVNNETQALSFRTVAHLFVVDETKMQSETSPAITGNYTTKTAELSALKLILQGDDDSDITAATSRADRSRIVNAKSEVIDTLLAELEENLRNITTADQLHAQLDRINSTVSEQNAGIAEKAEQRRVEASRLSQLHQQFLEAQQRAGDIDALVARFERLAEKYESDLGRLEMIGEAGTFLGFFNPGKCVFCGAEPQHQHPNGHTPQDVTHFGQAIHTERAKTAALRSDLLQTLADLADERSDLTAQLANLASAADLSRDRVAKLDQEISPQRVDVTELLTKRSTLERHISDYDQVDKLNRLKAAIAVDGQAEATAAAAGFDQRTITQFSQAIAARLTAWGFPGSEAVHYDKNEQDLVAGDQLRSAHGKGVRAILHAAFTIGLAQFCVSRGMPHPGFVILDSPLVTYRPPDVGEEQKVDDVLPADFVTRFYRDIQELSGIQVLVMENIDPPNGLDHDSDDVQFSGNMTGRFGFFPPRVD